MCRKRIYELPLLCLDHISDLCYSVVLHLFLFKYLGLRILLISCWASVAVDIEFVPWKLATIPLQSLWCTNQNLTDCFGIAVIQMPRRTSSHSPKMRLLPVSHHHCNQHLVWSEAPHGGPKFHTAVYNLSEGFVCIFYISTFPLITKMSPGVDSISYYSIFIAFLTHTKNRSILM
jgi:hypothetical protein